MSDAAVRLLSLFIILAYAPSRRSALLLGFQPQRQRAVNTRPQNFTYDQQNTAWASFECVMFSLHWMYSHSCKLQFGPNILKTFFVYLFEKKMLYLTFTVIGGKFWTDVH